MNGPANVIHLARGGILIHGATERDIEAVKRDFRVYLGALGLENYVKATTEATDDRPSIRFGLCEKAAAKWSPGHDTLGLSEKLRLDIPGSPCSLEQEILLTMLLGPIAFEFPSYDELLAAIRIRRNIVEAARQTILAFHTTEAERPEDYWTYTEGSGFTVLPGKPLIIALQKATQPDAGGKLYSFSCYRATEYVILLGIAQELATSNPELLHQLQTQWEIRAIMSGQFHDVFLREYGSMSEPLPPKYYVPGDRLWFRNPDAHSSDVGGYEGSWVFYMGGGMFTNFWKRDKPYTLTSKCLELFHWRNATYRDSAGELRIDEAIVEERVHRSLQDPAEVEWILGEMLRYREPQGIYSNGGCIDTSREYPRGVCPATSDLVFPELSPLSD